MVGAGAHVFSVWAYAISHAVKSRVELNPEYLWRIIGSTKQEMVDAIEFLCRPDPASRHPESEGRRLVKEGAYQYFLPQFERYQKIKNNDDLREQNRIRQARHRAKKGGSARERQFDKALGDGNATVADGLSDAMHDKPVEHPPTVTPVENPSPQPTAT